MIRKIVLRFSKNDLKLFSNVKILYLLRGMRQMRIKFNSRINAVAIYLFCYGLLQPKAKVIPFMDFS